MAIDAATSFADKAHNVVSTSSSKNPPLGNGKAHVSISDLPTVANPQLYKLSGGWYIRSGSSPQNKINSNTPRSISRPSNMRTPSPSTTSSDVDPHSTICSGSDTDSLQTTVDNGTSFVVPGIAANFLNSRKTLTITDPPSIWFYRESLLPLIAPSGRPEKRPRIYNIVSNHLEIVCQPFDPPWMRNFLLGSINADVELQNTCARRLVAMKLNSTGWTDNDLRALCEAFVFRVAEFYNLNGERDPLPSFALSIFHQICALAGNQNITGDRFCARLEHEVSNMVLFVWKDPRYSVNAYTSQNPDYVAGALNLCKFMADLYCVNLVSEKTIFLALERLYTNLGSIHHLQAILSLLVHTGPALWYETPSWKLYQKNAIVAVAKFSACEGDLADYSQGTGKLSAIRLYDEIRRILEAVPSRQV